MKVLALVSKFALPGGKSTTEFCLLFRRCKCLHLMASVGGVDGVCEFHDGNDGLAISEVAKLNLSHASFHSWTLIKLKDGHEPGHLEFLAHFLFHCGIQFTIVIVQASDILLDWHVVVSFEVVDQTIDPDHIFFRVTIEIIFEDRIAIGF